MVETKSQRSLVVYFESRLVDYSGRVQVAHMNGADVKQAEAWAASGLIGFGRIAWADTTPHGTHWVTFTDAAWFAAHTERRARAERIAATRTYRTVAEDATGTDPAGRVVKSVGIV